MDHIQQITIVGPGLLGGSCGLGLRAAGYRGRIAGVSRRLETAERARELGCVDTAGTDLGPPLRDSQLVVIAIPLSRYEPVFRQVARHDHQGLAITDVGSTKQQVCDLARRLLPEPARFVGSHPMAGSEQHGPDAARANLFEDKPCVVTAGPHTDPAAQRTIESLWTTLRMRLIRMPADEHDRQVARISHLPHLLAVLMVHVAGRLGGLDLASTGFMDTTRPASGDPQIWLDIFTTNRSAIAETVSVFHQELSRFSQILSQAQDQAVLELLAQNKDVRDNWIKRFAG